MALGARGSDGILQAGREGEAGRESLRSGGDGRRGAEAEGWPDFHGLAE